MVVASARIVLLGVVLSVALPGWRHSHAGPATADYVEDLVLKAHGLELGKRKRWLRFGYWRETTLGGLRSEVDGPEFFLAKDGQTNPTAELEATLRAIFKPASGDEHPRCRFPARYRWLRHELDIDESRVAQKQCPKLDRFLSNLQAESVTLVFSSYYLNNAASAFGHTFLRVNRKAAKKGEERQSLLDTGINYSATVTTSNALLYAFQGLFGMFRGHFTALPYFYKVREYNDYESRDLWEYQLSIDGDDLRIMLDHIWELGSTHFEYWYLSENCSYHILTTLEAADPSLELRDQLLWPVIPADTVKAVAESPGLVKSITFRPSARTQLEARTRDMSGEMRGMVAKLSREPDLELPADLGREQRIRVLDAAADVIDIRHAKELVHTDKDSEGARLKQALLQRRAQIPVASKELEVKTPWHRMPSRGHDSRRLTFGGGYAGERGGFTSMRMRLAMHDLADSTPGYPDTTRLEFLPTTLRFWVPDGRAALESMYLVRVASLSPISRFDRAMSWRLDAGVKRVADEGCDDCLAGHFELGGGLTFGLGRENRFMLYVMSDVVLGYGRKVQGIQDTGFRAGIGPGSGVRMRWTPELITLITGAWHWLPDAPSLAEWNASFITRWQVGEAIALDIEMSANAREQTGQGSWLVYF